MEENGWYHTGVDFMVKNGFMNGVADDAFDVDGNLTRAQLVTILYRIAGEPETRPRTRLPTWRTVSGTRPLSSGQRRTASSRGVNTTTFAPNDQITREQIATILFRYAKAEKVEGKLAKLPGCREGLRLRRRRHGVGSGAGPHQRYLRERRQDLPRPAGDRDPAQIAVILMRYLTAEN